MAICEIGMTGTKKCILLNSRRLQYSTSYKIAFFFFEKRTSWRNTPVITFLCWSVKNVARYMQFLLYILIWSEWENFHAVPFQFISEFKPWLRQCTVFLGKTLHSHSASLHFFVYRYLSDQVQAYATRPNGSVGRSWHVDTKYLSHFIIWLR